MSSATRPGRLAPHSPLVEPDLSFSAEDLSAVDTHPLRGLRRYGPYTKHALMTHTDQVRVAIVGPSEGAHGRRQLIRKLLTNQQPTDRKNYVPAFPGFAELFGVPLVPAPAETQLEWPSDLGQLGDGTAQERVRRALSERLRQLAAHRDQFDVAVLHLPDSWEPGLRAPGFDAHDEAKAIGAELGIPTQIINDRTFGFGHPASLAWRLSIALYVKAGGTPWRLAPLPGIPDGSAYVGLAYALRGDPREARFVTCCSQVFDADGGGMQFVAYDARDPLDDTEEARRNPYLSRSDMRAVLARSMRLYQRRNGGALPRRVVLHKTTPFRSEELAGANDALVAVDELECLEITTSTTWRGVWLTAASTPDRFPVHRGILQQLSDRAALVWVAGNAPSVAQHGDSFYQGGKSIPAPMLLTRHQGRGPLEVVGLEALALTKMDWNNDALYDQVPVTVAYSKRLARTIANAPTLARREYPYRMFM